MKKKTLVTLGIALVVCLSACGNKDNNSTEKETIAVVDITKPAAEEQETQNVPIHSEDKIVVETIAPQITVEGTDGVAVFIEAGQDPEEISDPVARRNYEQMLGINTEVESETVEDEVESTEEKSEASENEVDTNNNNEVESTEEKVDTSENEVESTEGKAETNETISEDQINNSINEYTKKQAEEWDANVDWSTAHKVK